MNTKVVKEIQNKQASSKNTIIFVVSNKTTVSMKIWKAKELIDLVERNGWFLVRQKGSHKHYRHFDKPGTVTIPYSGNDDVPPGTANSILKQAGLK